MDTTWAGRLRPVTASNVMVACWLAWTREASASANGTVTWKPVRSPSSMNALLLLAVDDEEEEDDDEPPDAPDAPPLAPEEAAPPLLAAGDAAVPPPLTLSPTCW